MRISDWSSDVCSSDLRQLFEQHTLRGNLLNQRTSASKSVADKVARTRLAPCGSTLTSEPPRPASRAPASTRASSDRASLLGACARPPEAANCFAAGRIHADACACAIACARRLARARANGCQTRSEEHTSELQS